MTDGKLSSLHISFVQLVTDLMLVGFPFGCMFLSYNFRSIEAFSSLSVLNSLYSRFLHSKREDSVPSKLHKISG